MGSLSADLAIRPTAPAGLVREGLLCALLAGLAASLAVLLLRDERRRVHLRRAREVLSHQAYPPSQPWP